ncbi:MAG: hypothetical protein IH628_04190 [Proteobacteria bacterium]|nr:hypothetical protein [Pseudomonadota bacterium]
MEEQWQLKSTIKKIDNHRPPSIAVLGNGNFYSAELPRMTLDEVPSSN